MFQIIFDSYHPGFDAATSKTLIELLITCNQQIMIFVLIYHCISMHHLGHLIKLDIQLIQLYGLCKSPHGNIE